MTETKNKVKLSQWDALLVESLRSLGWSDEELLRRVAEGDLPADESEYEFDYGQLSTLAGEQPKLFRQAVTEGYQIKYNTIRGIRSWIAVALRTQPKLELEEGREAVEAVLSESQKQRLEDVLSFGWQITGGGSAADGGNATYRIEPIQR
ncbi:MULTISPECIES: hypothetical protein [Paenibacillus]|jgi:hypothetical protein|uniref:hypothetical protein n=1 Tax=Paenibacillus TaxID=44249 RepID=UPI0004F5D6D1|nr:MULTISPECIES: hypothetical protein [unclassified Paenibacillus]AIQ27070.1 hypothetical protein P40081_01790 [Paenibacillus sp. FSL P4-0081]OMF29587.1 hypothetical protein BK132_11075 [Paenibacillus sp. FSL H8-0259]